MQDGCSNAEPNCKCFMIHLGHMIGCYIYQNVKLGHFFYKDDVLRSRATRKCVI